MAISKDRLEEIQWFYDNETNDPDTQEWRDELSEEEEALVDEWDKQYCNGVSALCSAILKHMEV